MICFGLNAQTFEVNHQSWDSLLKQYVSPQGRVDYLGFQNDKVKLEAYIESLAESAPAINTQSKAHQLSFWINAYNACTIKLICDNLPLESIKDMSRPWKQTVLKNKSDRWTLDAIEHEILRNYNEPRIHFAINCASKSCPILANEAYTADRIEDQLNRAAAVFLRDTSKNKYTPKRLYLSRIFLWFKKDFGKTEDIIEMMNRYTGQNIPSDTSISYLTYDWSLNN
jgi:hypothetical protein